MSLKPTLLLLMLLLMTAVVTAKKSKDKTKTKTKTKSGTKNDVSSPGDNSNDLVTPGSTPPQRPGATITLTSSGTVLPPYSQISSSQLSTSSGLQCNGDIGATSAQWMLPNGLTLEQGESNVSVNLQVRRNPTPSEPNLELLRVSSGDLGVEGVFWCIVVYSEYTDMYPIWIMEQTTAPSITSSSCKFGGFNPTDDAIGVFLFANISNGAPTSLSCQLPRGSVSDTRIFRQVLTSESPTEAVIRAGLSVPLDSVPGVLTCTVSNIDGSDTFTCNIQASTLGAVRVTDVSTDGSVVTVTWNAVSDPNGVLDSYMVHVVSSNGVDYIPFRQIEVTGTQAHIRGLYPTYSYQVTVVAVSSGVSSNGIVLPSISAPGDISSSQCHPANGQAVEIKLRMLEDCAGVDICSNTDHEGLVMAALQACGTGQRNCTAMNPEITKVYCKAAKETTPKNKKEKTKTKTKTGTSASDKEEMKIQAMAVCDPCVLENEPAPQGSEGTRQTPRRGKRSRKPRQIIDSNDCTLTFDGCQYSVKLDSKKSPQRLCGYSTISRSQESCDCPSQCYKAYNSTCRNSCSCGT